MPSNLKLNKMKKFWRNYHLPSNEQGKSLCGKRGVVIMNEAEWVNKDEMTKCKTCAKILNNQNR